MSVVYKQAIIHLFARSISSINPPQTTSQARAGATCTISVAA